MKHAIEIGEKYSITTKEFFVTPKGAECKAVFGEVTDILMEKYDIYSDVIVIGDMLVDMSQVYYAIKTNGASLGNSIYHA